MENMEADMVGEDMASSTFAQASTSPREISFPIKRESSFSVKREPSFQMKVKKQTSFAMDHELNSYETDGSINGNNSSSSKSSLDQVSMSFAMSRNMIRSRNSISYLQDRDSQFELECLPPKHVSLIDLNDLMTENGSIFDSRVLVRSEPVRTDYVKRFSVSSSCEDSPKMRLPPGLDTQDMQSNYSNEERVVSVEGTASNYSMRYIASQVNRLNYGYDGSYGYSGGYDGSYANHYSFSGNNTKAYSLSNAEFVKEMCEQSLQNNNNNAEFVKEGEGTTGPTTGPVVNVEELEEKYGVDNWAGLTRAEKKKKKFERFKKRAKERKEEENACKVILANTEDEEKRVEAAGFFVQSKIRESLDSKQDLELKLDAIINCITEFRESMKNGAAQDEKNKEELQKTTDKNTPETDEDENLWDLLHEQNRRWWEG